MGTIAKLAGVSTRTVYRLFPGKQDLLADVISRQIDRFLWEIDLSTLSGLSIREGLARLMTAYGFLTLSDDAVRMAKLVVSESSRFPEVSAAFYEKAVVPTNRVIEGWLREQMELGEISGGNPAEASGILRGMMAMEPQRASLMSQQRALTEAEIEKRASECVERFLGGCAVVKSTEPETA
jgi:AcrR family transcriptional regulator